MSHVHQDIADAILQTNPDLRCLVGGSVATFGFTHDITNTWAASSDLQLVFEAFRKPTAVRTVFKHITQDTLRFLNRHVKIGVFLTLNPGDRSAQGSKLTAAMLALGAEANPLAGRRRASAYITRHELVDGKPIFVLDGLFQKREIAAVDRFLSLHSYIFNVGDYDRRYLHWGFLLPIDLPFFRRIKDAIDELFPKMHLEPFKALCNIYRYADHAAPHSDFEEPSVTALYYANRTWDSSWMGETVFYGTDAEPKYVVAPKPGRIVLARGDILHRSGIPSRLCHAPRMTIAAQYQTVSRRNKRT